MDVQTLADVAMNSGEPVYWLGKAIASSVRCCTDKIHKDRFESIHVAFMKSVMKGSDVTRADIVSALELLTTEELTRCASTT